MNMANVLKGKKKLKTNIYHIRTNGERKGISKQGKGNTGKGIKGGVNESREANNELTRNVMEINLQSQQKREKKTTGFIQKDLSYSNAT